MARSLVTTSGALRPEAVREAAQLFSRGELIEVHVPGEGFEEEQRARAAIYTGDDVVYSVRDGKRLSLSLSKNIILHFFVNHALVSAAFLMRPATTVEPDVLRERVLALSRLFKFEFLFRADATFDRIFNDTLTAMLGAGELTVVGEQALTFGPGHHQLSGRGWVVFYADILLPFLEGYRVAARTATSLLKGPLLTKDFLKRALVVGDRMFLEGDISRREAVTRPVLENALLALQDQQLVQSREGKISLSPPFDSSETVTAIEGRIRSFLGHVPEEEGGA